MAVVSVENAPHYQWGHQCDGWRLTQSDRLSVIEERMPPGAKETRHAHQHSEQFFYILLGDAIIEIDGASHHLSKGQGASVPPGAAHQIANNGAIEVVFLVISAPPVGGDRVEE